MVDRQFRPPGAGEQPAFVRYLQQRRRSAQSQQWMDWWRMRQQIAAQQQYQYPQAVPQPAYVAPVQPAPAVYTPPAQAAPQAAPVAAPVAAPAASMSFAPQAAVAPQAAPAPGFNPYSQTVGDREGAYAAFNRVRNDGEGGFAYDALRNSRGAQDELYLQNAGGSQAFDNWFRTNAGDFYNRYVADSAQTGGGDTQYSDWLYKNNMGQEFIRRPGANRGFFEGLYNPAARVII